MCYILALISSIRSYLRFGVKARIIKPLLDFSINEVPKVDAYVHMVGTWKDFFFYSVGY